MNLINLPNLGFPVEEARKYLHTKYLSILKTSSQTNKYGFRFSGRYLFDIPAVADETEWLMKHLYYSGLDKAANNACFICIKHIRLMALERLMGSDFTPCKIGEFWSLPSTILASLSNDLLDLLPEFPPQFHSLPYLMATFKQHKNKYRWLTNAFQTVFSNIAVMLTLTSKPILEAFKTWAHTKALGYKRFLRVNTRLYWIIDSVIDTTLNLPSEIHDIFVADICRCYESIPLQGPDNLFEALTFVLSTAFKQANLEHPKTTCHMWVKRGADGTPKAAKWATHQPKLGVWIEFSLARLLKLHDWLSKNCHLTLGDRVWRQCKGIPMGFSCSPIWCSMYLLSYESRFILRLAKLGRADLLSKFAHPFRYIDDLCLLNVQNPRAFLSPSQPRSSDNPWWIYPLDILDIKEETEKFSSLDPNKGISANFLNVNIQVDETHPQNFHLQKYDKHRTLPFDYSQYIKFSSNRAIN